MQQDRSTVKCYCCVGQTNSINNIEKHSLGSKQYLAICLKRLIFLFLIYLFFIFHAFVFCTQTEPSQFFFYSHRFYSIQPVAYHFRLHAFLRKIILSRRCRGCSKIERTHTHTQIHTHTWKQSAAETRHRPVIDILSCT